MKRKIVIGILLTLLLTSLSTLAFSIQRVKGWTGTVYIRANGSIDPPDAPISTVDNVTYTLTGNVTTDGDGIVVERDNIVIDGAGYMLQGTVVYPYTGISLSGRENVTVRNVQIKNFNYGIYLHWVGFGVGFYSSSNSISGNNITNNSFGIYLGRANDNKIYGNNIADNSYGVFFDWAAQNNTVYGNNIENNELGICLDGYISATYKECPENNTICENNIADNTEAGVKLLGLDNIFYHNNFLNNTIVIGSEFNSGGTNDPKLSKNILDNGYPSGGNYWSDYIGVDVNGDGIGDTPYVIDANNTDYYPLMYPWSSLPVHNINTGLGYATIQEAINANETLNGHIIFVEEGTYFEHVVMNKTLALIGEGRNSVIIDGNQTGTVVTITANNVLISNFTIRNSGGWLDAGIDLDSTSYCNVTGNHITNNYYGVVLSGSSNNTVSENNITANSAIGIALWGSLYNGVSRNNILNNTHGIVGEGYSGYNSISGNNVASNSGDGIVFWELSDYNVISGNSITMNEGRGVYLASSLHNSIYHNNFLNNRMQASLHESAWYTTWDDGYPSGGNYWSDYNGTDVYDSVFQNVTGSDGVGDTALIIDAYNRDSYPLMAPINIFNVAVWNGEPREVYVVSNSTISSFQLNAMEKILRFNVTGETGFGFCRLTIPNIIVQDLWHGNYTVLINGEPCPFKNWTDTENTYLYVNYTHSEHEITIIPEFPSTMILPLFMVLTMLAVVFTKKRLPRKP